MTFAKVLREGHCRLCGSPTDLMRYFLIPYAKKKEPNVVPVCCECLQRPDIASAVANALRPEEEAYVVHRRSHAFLEALRIGGT